MCVCVVCVCVCVCGVCVCGVCACVCACVHVRVCVCVDGIHTDKPAEHCHTQDQLLLLDLVQESYYPFNNIT